MHPPSNLGLVLNSIVVLDIPAEATCKSLVFSESILVSDEVEILRRIFGSI